MATFAQSMTRMTALTWLTKLLGSPAMISDLELSAAKSVRTQCGWFDFYNITAESVAIVGDFLDYRIPRSMILETR